MTGYNTDEWRSVPTDPDLEIDLGYEEEELIVVKSSTDGKLIILPELDSQEGEEEFLTIYAEDLEQAEPVYNEDWMLENEWKKGVNGEEYLWITEKGETTENGFCLRADSSAVVNPQSYR